MSRNRLGVWLSTIGIAAVLWLAAADRLHWYIHPRYLGFTVSMCVIGAILAIGASIALARERVADPAPQDSHDHHHDPKHDRERLPLARRSRALSLIAGSALLVATIAALLIVPPSTLSAQTAQQRQLKATSTLASATPADGEEPTLQQWAMMLQNGGSEAEGRAASFLGFIVPDDEDPENLFYVTRFVVSCCAVDAQPLGIPVADPGWSDELQEGDWVEVGGVFAANADVTSPVTTVLRPNSVEETDTPDDPYVY